MASNLGRYISHVTVQLADGTTHEMISRHLMMPKIGECVTVQGRKLRVVTAVLEKLHARLPPNKYRGARKRQCAHVEFVTAVEVS